MNPGKDSEIPEDSPISVRGIQELSRNLQKQEKQSTPRISEGESVCPSQKACRLLEFRDSPPSERSSHQRQPSMIIYGPALAEGSLHCQNTVYASRRKVTGLNSTNTSFVNSFGKSSVVSAAHDPVRAQNQKVMNEICTTDKDSEDEQALWILPTYRFCLKCQKENPTVIHVQLPTLSGWKVICCFRDLLQWCTHEADWAKYQSVIHLCAKCHHFIGRVDVRPS